LIIFLPIFPAASRPDPAKTARVIEVFLVLFLKLLLKFYLAKSRLKEACGKGLIDRVSPPFEKNATNPFLCSVAREVT
jgi:hypothetical protein